MRAESTAMTDHLLSQLELLLRDLAFPATKEEVSEHLAAQQAAAELLWLLRVIPGLEFHFASDVLSTSRIALEMDIQRPWPEHLATPGGYTTDESIVATVKQRLVLCGEANEHLVKLQVCRGEVVLSGRAPDVPRGVMAARVAAGVVGQDKVVNRLQVIS